MSHRLILSTPLAVASHFIQLIFLNVKEEENKLMVKDDCRSVCIPKVAILWLCILFLIWWYHFKAFNAINSKKNSPRESLKSYRIFALFLLPQSHSKTFLYNMHLPLLLLWKIFIIFTHSGWKRRRKRKCVTKN